MTTQWSTSANDLCAFETHLPSLQVVGGMHVHYACPLSMHRSGGRIQRRLTHSPREARTAGFTLHLSLDLTHATEPTVVVPAAHAALISPCMLKHLSLHHVHTTHPYGRVGQACTCRAVSPNLPQ